MAYNMHTPMTGTSRFHQIHHHQSPGMSSYRPHDQFKPRVYQVGSITHGCHCRATFCVHSDLQDADMANPELENDTRSPPFFAARSSPERSWNLEDSKMYDVHEQKQTHDHWDEEATLIALLDEDNESSPSHKFAVVDRLQSAFRGHRLTSKEFLRETIIPVITQLRDAHDQIEHEIIPLYLEGLRVFHANSQKLEDASRLEQAAVQAAYLENKSEMQVLFNQLNQTNSGGRKLIMDLNSVVTDQVKRLQACADSFPQEVEQLISRLDKKSKSLISKEDTKSKEKLLRSILEKY